MKIDEDIAEILGIQIGDGCISENKRYSEIYLGGDITEEKEYHDLWVGPLINQKIMLPIFNKKVFYKEHPKVGIYGFHIFDKKVVNFFKNFGLKSGSKKNVSIPQEILKNKKLLKRFIRGLFDTDGNIYFDKNRSAKNPENNRPIITLGTISKKLAYEVLGALASFGLHPRMKKPYKGKKDKNKVYRVVIYRMNDIRYYINQIGFKNTKHSTKWELYKKLGVCPSKTNIKQRKELLKG